MSGTGGADQSLAAEALQYGQTRGGRIGKVPPSPSSDRFAVSNDVKGAAVNASNEPNLTPDAHPPAALALPPDDETDGGDEAQVDLTAPWAIGDAHDEPISPALAELPGLLAASPSGLDFVYQALEFVARRYGLSDAAAIVDGSSIGRQVFRLRGVRSAGASRPASRLPALRHAPPGLYAAPPVVDRMTSVFIANMADVALRWDLARRDAGHDALTGLFNRRLYEASLEQAMARSKRYGWPFALVLLDMDNFKLVNLKLGHAGGDAALRILGGELRACLRSGDVAARIGGDEFALLILNTDSPAVLSPLSDRLQGALDRAALGTELHFSAGVACFPVDGVDAAELTRAADQRLYAAKAAIS